MVDEQNVRTSAGGDEFLAGMMLRLRMAPSGQGRGELDGAWWPRSRNLRAELPPLIEALDAWLAEAGPEHGGYVSRVAVSLTSWVKAPGHLAVDGRRIELSWFGAVDAHTLSASCPNGRRIDLLVVPPETATDAAGVAMAVAADGSNTDRGSAILAAVAPLLLMSQEQPRLWNQPPAPATNTWATAPTANAWTAAPATVIDGGLPTP
ncbi:MAG: DUF5994 family protein [Actinocatenispora sp.]